MLRRSPSFSTGPPKWRNRTVRAPAGCSGCRWSFPRLPRPGRGNVGVFSVFDFVFFMYILLPPVPFNPAPLPFTPQFSPFPACYLTYPYRHAILSRVSRIRPLPKRCLCIPNEPSGRRLCGSFTSYSLCTLSSLFSLFHQRVFGGRGEPKNLRESGGSVRIASVQSEGSSDAAAESEAWCAG